MIPNLIKIIISKFHFGINWIKDNFNLVAVFIISIFTAIIVLQHNQLQQNQFEIDRLNNNVLYFQEQTDSIKDDSRTLQLTIEELKDSRDSIITKLNDTRKQLNIKDKELKLAQSSKQQIKLDTTLVVKNDDFEYVIKPNTLTSLVISKKDSILNAKIDIKNEQTLFISNKREYRNKYKNWFRRLLHFDFKRRNKYQYNIVNSNDLIVVTDTRVVQIEK